MKRWDIRWLSGVSTLVLALACSSGHVAGVVGLKDTFADEVFDKLLNALGDEKRTQLLDLLDGVSNDQSLLFQLTEAGCDLFNATTGKPDQLRYASVVTCARGGTLPRSGVFAP